MSHPATQSSSPVGPSAKKKRVSDSAKSKGYNIGLVGSGNIARAIVEGVLASGNAVRHFPGT